MQRSWYAGTIEQFLSASDDAVLAELVKNSEFDIAQTQRDAWCGELPILRNGIAAHTGAIHLEFAVPRMGRRVDTVVFVSGVVFVVEFKVGQNDYMAADIDQVYDYALDLKYFHEGSHKLSVVPILVATNAADCPVTVQAHAGVEGLFLPIRSNARGFRFAIEQSLATVPKTDASPIAWGASRYCPTPTIVEAAKALYAGHSVADISRRDAEAINLEQTAECLMTIIEGARRDRQKAICFVTGVPGAGKTLAGLNIATKYNDPSSELHSVFLSGNGPLVAILREALARDMVERERVRGRRLKKNEAMSRVKTFIQNVHHFRDECLRDQARPPVDHVALFDEAQRAWNRAETASFMRRKKRHSGFAVSEPEYLISCMDRRPDWAVILCLVGGGQEINRGEAGIGEWIAAVRRSFDHWHLFISPRLRDSEYGAGRVLDDLQGRTDVHYHEELHLAVSLRSFRSEKVSDFVKKVLDCDTSGAQSLLRDIGGRYPVVLTRDLDRAKGWLREHACGSERYGIVVSSQAERLKPYAIDVRAPVNPIKWFLDGKDDIRSSYYLEDVATEFHVQGLELDWVCVSWDGDFRYTDGNWNHFSFRGTRWQRIRQDARKGYLKNAYRVLLTRARQGMVIFVPRGSSADPTRDPTFYDPTYRYLREIGIEEV